MSQLLKQPSIVPATRASFSKINSFFDGAITIVERTDELLTKAKPTLVNLFLFLHLLIDLIIVLSVLVWKFG